MERTGEIDAEALLIADGAGEVIISCSYADINVFSSEKPLEREANLFASELLFPASVFLADIHGMDLSWNAIQASLTATALRMCQKTMDSCALLLAPIETEYEDWFGGDGIE